MRAMKEELRQAGHIAAGKPFLLRRKFKDPKYAQLGQLWGAEDAYLDLAASAADTVAHFRGQKDDGMEELFWSQFHAPTRPLPLSDKMAAVAELHRLSGLAMRSVIDNLWPKGPKSDNYFGLVQQFLGVVPHISNMKRLVCIEGAHMALARVKTYCAEMEATAIATQSSAVGRVSAEHYFEEVLEGARSIEAQCSKNIIF